MKSEYTCVMNPAPRKRRTITKKACELSSKQAERIKRYGIQAFLPYRVSIVGYPGEDKVYWGVIYDRTGKVVDECNTCSEATTRAFCRNQTYPL